MLRAGGLERHFGPIRENASIAGILRDVSTIDASRAPA
jgi:hypothetical protein